MTTLVRFTIDKETNNIFRIQRCEDQQTHYDPNIDYYNASFTLVGEHPITNCYNALDTRSSFSTLTTVCLKVEQLTTWLGEIKNVRKTTNHHSRSL